MKLHAPALLSLMLALAAPFAAAKLPPLTPEAQAKADEAKAKAAWTDKVSAYQLCRAMERTAESYYKTAKAASRETKPPVATPPCSDPGAFVAAAPAAAATPPSVSSAPQAQLQGAKK